VELREERPRERCSAALTEAEKRRMGGGGWPDSGGVRAAPAPERREWVETPR
jgi:hypothetical protein